MDVALQHGSRQSWRMGQSAFLRIPPFPGHKGAVLAVSATAQWGKGEEPDDLVRALRAARVGGAFWAAQPILPTGRDIIVAPDSQEQARAMLDRLDDEGLFRRAILIGPFASVDGVPVIASLCDPWALVDQAVEVRAGARNELALVAAVIGKRTQVVGEGRFAGLDARQTELPATGLNACIAAELVRDRAWRDPFSGRAMLPSEAIALLAQWRALIDANRKAAAVYGVAMWKRVTMDALLWDGSGPVRHARWQDRRSSRLGQGDAVLAWKSRTSPALPDALAARGIAVGEIEDGMIRSAGLGANCVPPLSVIVDFDGAHFDPAQPSGLERILQDADIPSELTGRAAALRGRLVEAGISKYGMDRTTIPRPASRQKRILVTGQVEDDRSMLSGGAGCTNLDVVRRARASEPDAWIVYKPHPDVEAGHRKGAVDDAEILRHADVVERSASMPALLDSVDAVHVITSLTGFEALMRGKEVVTHGVPFYAGWGLTRDHGPVPPRRSRRRTVDELVAATLILYPRYIDPVTRLPCPVEVLVERMANGQAIISSPLVRIREAQGRLNRMIHKLKRSA